jgi:hypothetical protein
VPKLFNRLASLGVFGMKHINLMFHHVKLGHNREAQVLLIPSRLSPFCAYVGILVISGNAFESCDIGHLLIFGSEENRHKGFFS